jgi:hypothetical protein
MTPYKTIKRIRSATIPFLRLWLILICGVLVYPLWAQDIGQNAVSSGAGLVSGGNYTGYVSAGQMGTYLYASATEVATQGIILNEINAEVEFTFELSGTLTENEAVQANALVLKSARALLQGNPLAFTDVYLILVETGEIYGSTQTDANGFFRFENVPYKNFYFTVNTPELPAQPLKLNFDSNIFIKKVEINGELGVEGITASVMIVPQNTCSSDQPDYIIWYLDDDGDGYGNPNYWVGQCTKPVGYVDNGLDCDDSDPDIYPGAPEIPGSGIDSNCDGIFLNNPPVAIAGDPQTVQSGDIVYLDASDSYDPDGYPVTFEWIAPDGIVLDNYFVSNPQFTAPSVAITTDFVFTVVVTDNLNSSAQANVVITVLSTVNHPPVAHAGEDFSIDEGTTIRLNGRGSYDPDGDVITYKWTASEGITLQSPNSAVPQFTAPPVDQDTEFEFVLVVNDGFLDSEPDVVVVTVRNVNSPPVVVCNNLTVNLNLNGTYTLTKTDLAQLAAGTTDDHTSFENLIITASPSVFSCENIGQMVEVTVFVTDQVGETSSCTSLVTVLDILAPVYANGSKNHRIIISDGEVYVLPDLSVLFPAKDNCGVVSYSQVPAAGTVYSSATTQLVTLTAYDASGNSASTTVSFSLTVKKSKTKSAEISLVGEELFESELIAYPNPFSNRLNIEFTLAENSKVRIEMFNSIGSKIAQIYEGYLEAGVLNRFEYLPGSEASQLMFYQVTVQDKVFRGKVIYNK